MTFDSVLIIAGVFLFSVLTVALILRISRRMSWYDHINERKIHTGNIPRLGGLGFAIPFIVCTLVIILRFLDHEQGIRFLPVFFALILILISGVRDDFKPMAPRYKLIFQTGAAICVLASGYTFKRFFFTGSETSPAFPGWELLSYPLSFLWIVGMTNAVNFIDGVDGLAGGISLLAVLTFGIVLMFLGTSSTTPLLCICLAAAILGFLMFNAPFPRARIFMGDGGAYFLGFTLALFPLMGDGLGLPVLYAAAILMIPILDTTAAVWRRLRDHRRIDSPDRSHTHHKLMNLGLSSRRIDAILFTLQAVLGVLVYAAVKTPPLLSFFLLALSYVTGIGFFTTIHFLNRGHNRALAKASAAGFPRAGKSGGPDREPAGRESRSP
ncbi:MAG: undecaprenyl/decaprenyl-phosphate alpha-N-acetylglucosaminyl 1-phosphate transferase [Treponema sp.]|nr:undecaprenyl/decaprenyl-phosphate alpha-N-acetylglucosaminyl 1-phosphate transferase [Treponema sp.]